MKRLTISATLIMAAISTASAETLIDWRGGGTFFDVQDCPSSDFDYRPAFEGRYRHPGVGDNSPNATFSIFTPTQTFNVTSPAGPFSKTLQTVNGTTIGAGGGPFAPKVKVIKLMPPQVTDTTKIVKLSVLIQNFGGPPSGNENCSVLFEFTGTRCEKIIGTAGPATCATD